MSREFEEKMMQYIKYLDEQSPVISRSNYMLRDIYDQYGVVPVDNWLNNFYGKHLDKERKEG